jgi:hypothetical protein
MVEIIAPEALEPQQAARWVLPEICVAMQGEIQTIFE